MKPFYIPFILFILVCDAVFSQNRQQNYICNRVMLHESDHTKKVETIQYYDGLGRPSLNVQKGITPKHNNLASLQEYDSSGRESKSWLPHVTASDYLVPSTLKSQIAGNSYNGDTRPYGESLYEASPLNRVTQQYGPGAGWATHPVSMEYLTNEPTGVLSCKQYVIISNMVAVSAANYPAGQLYVNKITDEDGHIAYTFTDKLGRRILNRQMLGSTGCDTYFVYDGLNLRFVLPPGYQDEGKVDLYAYQYKYDNRNRCIQKKLPGCEPIYYVYDYADKLVFSQNGVQRANGEWTFYLYDKYQRPVVQGVCKNTNTSSVSETTMVGTLHYNNNVIVGDGLGNSGYSSNFGLSSPTVHTINYYDNYDFLSLTGFTDRSLYPVATVNAMGLPTGKVSCLFASSKPKFFYSAFYYDTKGRIVRSTENNYRGGNETTLTDYTFTGKPLHVTHIHTAPQKATQTELYTYEYDHAERVTKVTHKLNNYPAVVLSENTYDELGRLIGKKRHGNNDLNTEYVYNIRDWLVHIKSKEFYQLMYYNTDGSTPQYGGNISKMGWHVTKENKSVYYDFSYDDLNRLTNAKYTIPNASSGKFNTSYTYNKMGNITGLTRRGNSNSIGIMDIDDLTLYYKGNQLKQVTDAAKKRDPLYNGAFNFVDGADDMQEYEYDDNGNLIKDLNKGISKIEYNILNLPDKITVNDSCHIGYGYSADGIRRHKEYYTDRKQSIIPLPDTGFETQDKSPQSSLPTTTGTNGILPPGGSGGIEIPDFEVGDMVPVNTNGYTSIDYCGNVLYETGIQKKILTSEGYITLSKDSICYHYYLKDHQGNNRVVVNQYGTVEEINHYYPFGGLFGKSLDNAKQSYKFSDKEFDRMHGLDWYDFVSRAYDPALARFHTMDPLCELYYSWSPYAYCMNNPIKYIDPTGALTSPYYSPQGDFLGVDENGFTGEIYITDAEAVREHSTNNTIDSEGIQSDSRTKFIRYTDLSFEAESKIYTDVLRRSSDPKLNISKLYNGKVSILDKLVMGNGRIYGKGYNNPTAVRTQPKYVEEDVGDKIKVTASRKSYQTDLFMVESIWNQLGIHEYWGHGIMHWKGDYDHWKVYKAQMQHPTYQKLPKDQKEDIIYKYNYYRNKTNEK